MRGRHLSHVAPKFERLLETHRREEGGRWSGVELERATGGVVTRTYVTNLRKGRIENPGMDKLAALVRAMGFPPTLWFEEGLSGADGRGAAGRPGGLVGRVGRLFNAIKDPQTGEPYTNSRIARMSLGDLTAEDVEGLSLPGCCKMPRTRSLGSRRTCGVALRVA
jgi:hypothetical protein